jgi:transposase
VGGRISFVAQNGSQECARPETITKIKKKGIVLKKYIIRLNDEERKQLSELVNKGKAAAYKRKHAQILLKADIAEDVGPGWPDQRIAEAFNVGVRTVERIRERLCKQGLAAAVKRAKGSGKRRKTDGAQEAHLIALVCGEAPDGHGRWTLRLLADRFVELGHIDSISYETVRQLLKKRNQTLAK